MTTVLTTRTGPTITLALNRPERLNAVSEELYQELIDGLVDADNDPQVRAIVLTGSGRAFCVGADLKAHKAGTRSREDQAHYLRPVFQCLEQAFAERVVIRHSWP